MKIAFVALGVAALVIGLAAGYWLLVTGAFSNSEEAGQFGDAFGALNAIFSGLALCGVVVSLHLQRKELRVQLEEFKIMARASVEQTKILAAGHKLELELSHAALERERRSHDPILEYSTHRISGGRLRVHLKNVGGRITRVACRVNRSGDGDFDLSVWSPGETRVLDTADDAVGVQFNLLFDHAREGRMSWTYDFSKITGAVDVIDRSSPGAE